MKYGVKKSSSVTAGISWENEPVPAPTEDPIPRVDHGQEITFWAEFTTDDGTPRHPSYVSLRIIAPDGQEWLRSSNTTGTFVKPATGRWEHYYRIPYEGNQAGQWSYYWEGRESSLGPTKVNASFQGRFEVNPNPFFRPT